MINTCLFYIISQVLKVLLIKCYMIQLPVLLFLVALRQKIDFLQDFKTSFFIIGKKIVTNFLFLTDLPNPPTTHLPPPITAKIH